MRIYRYQYIFAVFACWVFVEKANISTILVRAQLIAVASLSWAALLHLTRYDGLFGERIVADLLLEDLLGLVDFCSAQLATE